MRATALIVEQQPVLRAQIAGWVASAGFTVVECGGPQASDHACPSGDGICPLADDADVVLLDVSMSDDDLYEGPPGWQLLAAYLDAGKPVVALADWGEFPHLATVGAFTVIPRPPERTRLIEALRSALAHTDDADETRVGDLAVIHRRRPAPLVRR